MSHGCASTENLNGSHSSRGDQVRGGRGAAADHPVCPHIDSDDVRCQNRLCLQRIDQAFSVCFGAYRICPVYHRINIERRLGVASSDAQPAATGSTHAVALTLRATGS